MLIARAPVRISFGGGGTDLEPYYAVHGGFVVSASINKYFYTMLSAADTDHLQIISSDFQSFYRTSVAGPVAVDGELLLPKAVLNHFGLKRGFNVFLASEIPPGTGLGSSGAVAVTMIKALSTLLEQPLSKHDIAELAAHIEINDLGLPVGKQDQYASAYGGVVAMTFTKEGVTIEPLDLARDTLRQLESDLMLFFTGSARASSEILTEQKENSAKDPRVIEALHATKAIAYEVRACLERGDLRRFGELLDASWQQKKRFASNVTNSFIDECYDLALRHGASGGKITGAGGGGFLMLYCPQPYQEALTATLEAKGLKKMEFSFDYHGAQVILNTA